METRASVGRLSRKVLPSITGSTVVADVMTRNPVCVTADLSLEGLEALLLERGFSGAPVIDGGGIPIGMVSKTDLVREDYERGDVAELSEAEPLGDGFHEHRVARATVGEIMIPLAYTLGQERPLSEAIALMVSENVHRLPIVDGAGRVVGIVTSMDVLRWLNA